MAARHLSFTRAAQELFITQSAISREIKTLEEQIGTPLFRRAHRALQLTRAGEELYRATDGALASLDAATDRITKSTKSLAVTTTTALASLWLLPRLSRFYQLHPGLDVRITASNDKLDLEREQLDIAIQPVPSGSGTPNGEHLLDVEIFPVCSPGLAQHGTHPLRNPADLAHHVRLDFETIRDGRPWSEWDVWFNAMEIPAVEPASTLRFFSHYDQVIPAAIEGSGVAMGARPHLNNYLRDGVLCVPFGLDMAVTLSSFFIVLRRDVGGNDAVEKFVAWLRSEVRRDSELILAALHRANQVTAQPTHGTKGRKRANRL